MDVILSFLGLVILSPVILVAAIMILLEDGGPIFYTQIRIGKNKKEFRMYKLRSMKRNAEEIHEQMKREFGQTEVSFKLSDKEDPRVLKSGYYLRKFSIDELPQLVNIIKGDMSLVGPRPLPKYEFLDTEKEYGNKYDKRYSVDQGLTCYWQIAGRADISYEKRMEMDCQYADKAGLVNDIKLIFKTAIYAVLGKGEY
ncbi:MAG: sugar transferase [Acetatifactor sp.]